jgi:hypothetical protein
VSDRAHVLLLQANLTLSPPPAEPGGPAPDPIRLNSSVSWIGTSPADGRARDADRDGAARGRHAIWIDCGGARGAVVAPPGAGTDALQLQQVTLWRLPQGPGAAAAARGARGGGRGLPWELFTTVIWAVERWALGAWGPVGVRELWPTRTGQGLLLSSLAACGFRVSSTLTAGARLLLPPPLPGPLASPP